MRTRALSAAIATLGLGGPALSVPAETVVPQGRWHLKACLQVSYTRPHCAYLDQTHKLRVRDGSADEDRVLFEGVISAELAQQVLDRAVTVIRSFAAPSAVGSDADNLTIQLVVNGESAQVNVSSLSPSYQAGSGGKDLVKLLGQLTHAF